MVKTPLYQVDAFSVRAFGGNPAAVCLLEIPMADEWMQSVAAEMNLSETAFLLPENDGYRLRWFTPKVEVHLCGHATLASSHVLFETGRLKPDETARFYTLSGLLTARKDGEWVELNFPARQVEPIEPPAALVAALGVQPIFTGKAGGYLVEVASEKEVRGCTPDFERLKELVDHGVILTSRAASPEYDFVSRFFAPALGINEDPVTGSAHTKLAPYWAGKLGKTSFMAYQASARGGILKVRLDGERVLIAGQAVTVFRGELLA
jgi:PhzF family phenazine biosynthesis protein